MAASSAVQAAKTPTAQAIPPATAVASPASPSERGAAAATASRKRREFVLPREPVLRFTPTAWAKLLFFCHYGDTEIGGFGISDPDDLLLIQDFETVHQVVSSVTVAFDDTAVADFYEEQVDLGRKPQEFSRLWLHTHPGQSPLPSQTDEETFARVFGPCDWAVMAILARGGKTYARLRFNTGPGASLLIPVHVDYTQEFAGSDWEAWQQEYAGHVHAEPRELLAEGKTPCGLRARPVDRHRDRPVNEQLPDVLGEDPRDARPWWESWEEAGF
jgi:proteasome lid subunit RPN8/RPN11